MSEAAGFELGFNEESVAWVDGFIERQRIREDVGPELIDSLVSRLGSFLGECIRHHFGGEWKQRDGGMAVEFSAGNDAYPFNKVSKQFEYGSGDSILAFYETVGVLFNFSTMARTLTHAGGVVFRTSGDKTLYLVVSSSDGANWVLPKGHIEAPESAEAAALRELQEEAGVIGEIVERLSVQHFKKAKEEVAVQYFLIRELGATLATEQRTLRWEDELAAIQLLTFEEARAALREGAAVVRRLEEKQ